VTTTAYLPAQSLADAFDINLDSLRDANPALLDPVWIGTKHVPRGFPLRIPGASASLDVDAVLASVPPAERFAEQTPDLFHRVQRGEALSLIAARYRTSERELMALNGIRNRHRIRAGQVLRLPFAGAAPGPAIDGDADTYRVRKGDTLSAIAERAGISRSRLMALNDLTDPNRIYPGQPLILRETGTGEAAPPPARPAVPPVMAAVPAAEPAQPLAEPAQPVAEPLEDSVEESALPVAETPDTDDGQRLLADPSDYLVASDGSIEVQAVETLGHYADWLQVRTQRLRDMNGYSFRQPVVIGQRVKLDFSRISPDEFARRRITYHRELQEAYFTRYRVTETTVHKLRRGESVWVLAQRTYRVPVWLLRQYNPELDFDRVRPGDAIVFPRVERVQDGTPEVPAMVDNA
jgi:membrane-bound lytic murein transglycosylase D